MMSLPFISEFLANFLTRGNARPLACERAPIHLCHARFVHIHSYVRLMRRRKAADRVPSPFVGGRRVKLTSARESKRKEGDVTSRLRRIKRVNYMNRRARRWSLSTHTHKYARAPAHVYRTDLSCLLKFLKIELIKRHRASTLLSRIWLPSLFNPFNNDK